MDARDLLIDIFGRVPEEIATAIDGLDAETLAEIPEPGTNSIGWLVWHLTRVEDAHIAELVEEDQVWTTDGWADRFGVEADPENSGYGHTAEQVAAIRPDGADALSGYYGAVAARTRRYLEGLTPDELDRIVDERWDPPVTLGVRLVSIVDDEIQHAGQAAYARGLLEARRASV
jgi:uncharacterized damage-inducible protein DinB